MKGVWLGSSQAKIATGISGHDKFMKLAEDLKTRQHGKWPQYFIPLTLMDDKHKNFYKDELVEEPDEDDAEVEDIFGDITSLQSDTDDALKQARLENVKTRTKMLQEQLEARKEELFDEWSRKFFDVFVTSFGKFKNALVDLHLNEEQLKTLGEKFDLAISSLEDGLLQINTAWMNEEEEEEK